MFESARRLRPSAGAWPLCAWLLAACFAAHGVTAAQAIVQGHSSNLERHLVRVGGGGVICTGVAVGRQTVVTAAHCPAGSVNAGGAYIGVTAKLRGTVTLDDGTRVTVAGDSAILKLRAPLPASISPLPVADAEHDGHFIIAGYGTPSETNRSYGALREAVLVDSKVERHMLVDPHRTGAISASACFGDSGGPVLQRGPGGYQLVGVISRANYPNRAIACGFYTRYAPVRASGSVSAVASAPRESYALAGLTSADIASPASTPPAPKRVAQAKPKATKSEPEYAGFFSRFLARMNNKSRTAGR